MSAPSPSVQSKVAFLKAYYFVATRSQVFDVPAPPGQVLLVTKRSTCMCAHASACIVMQHQLLKGSLLAQDEKTCSHPQSAQRITASHYFLVRSMPRLEWFPGVESHEKWILIRIIATYRKQVRPQRETDILLQQRHVSERPQALSTFVRKANHDLLWLCFFFSCSVLGPPS